MLIREKKKIYSILEFWLFTEKHLDFCGCFPFLEGGSLDSETFGEELL